MYMHIILSCMLSVQIIVQLYLFYMCTRALHTIVPRAIDIHYILYTDPYTRYEVGVSASTNAGAGEQLKVVVYSREGGI